jgi:ATP-dependent Clp protease ATP-binding subunit ClpC
MFERFTEHARRAVALARDEARTAGHTRAGTEHLLLGLLGVREGVAAQALTSLGADPRAIHEQIALLGPAGTAAAPPPGQSAAALARGRAAAGKAVTWTAAARNVLEFARREALQLGHNHIGTEHLLLGLLRDPAFGGAQVLAGLGLDGRTVRRAVITLLHTPPAPAATT